MNAFALHLDARILREAKSLSRAYSIACVGIEELAKAKVCLGLYDADPQMKPYAKPENFWAFWTNHQLKVAMGLLDLDIEAESRPARVAVRRRTAAQLGEIERLEKYESALEESMQASEVMRIGREDGLYFDIISIGNNEVSFKHPHSIPPELAAEIIEALGQILETMRPRIESFMKATRPAVEPPKPPTRGA